jgi:hypothetical protein
LSIVKTLRETMKRESDVHQGFLSGAGFLGAVSITALVLVLSFPSTFQVNDWYFNGLLSLLAISSSSSVIASFFSIVVWGMESYGEEFRGTIRKFTAVTLTISLCALLMVIPMIVAPVSFFATIVAALFEGISTLVYLWASLKFRPHK